jgi:hypothetical protein
VKSLTLGERSHIATERTAREGRIEPGAYLLNNSSCAPLAWVARKAIPTGPPDPLR